MNRSRYHSSSKSKPKAPEGPDTTRRSGYYSTSKSRSEIGCVHGEVEMFQGAWDCQGVSYCIWDFQVNRNWLFQVNIGQSLYRWYGHETLHHPIVNGLVVYATSSGYRARMNR